MIPRLVIASVLLSLASVSLAMAGDNVLTRESDAPAQPLKSGRVISEEQKVLDSGLALYDRMGIDLPPLPPEKPPTGEPDEAYGAYQRGLYATAMDKALARAEKGDAAAQTLVAELTIKGLGVPRDVKSAAFWYSQAAKNGDANAMFAYAMMLADGQGVKRNQSEADSWMRKAADAGHPMAAFNHGQVLIYDREGPEGLIAALPYYELAADHGIADAQYAVALIYNNLPDLPQEKKDKARDYLLRAAKSGFDTAELDMGIWLVNAIAGPRDNEEGFRWMTRAANHGNVSAQNKLAYLYINAIGTAQDLVAAGKWYVLSRRAGLADPYLDDFFRGLTDAQQKAAFDLADGYKGPRG